MALIKLLLELCMVSWSMGAGFRFIYEFLNGKAFYQLNLFDTIFDFGGMFFFGMMMFIIILRDIKNKKKATKK